MNRDTTRATVLVGIRPTEVATTVTEVILDQILTKYTNPLPQDTTQLLNRVNIQDTRVSQCYASIKYSYTKANFRNLYLLSGVFVEQSNLYLVKLAWELSCNH